MAYIYKITNDINQKIYIGKTEFSIEKRFKEHCRDAFRERNEKRPLYAAMRKYGIEHFHIELIEKTDNPEERETYWIEYYNSFKNGYNATRGGDGKCYADYDLILSLYNECQSIKKVHELTGYDFFTIRTAINNTYSIEERRKNGAKVNWRPVARLDKNTGEILEVFSSISEAEKKYKTNRHICQVCAGKRKTAGGFKWKYLTPKGEQNGKKFIYYNSRI